MPKKRIHSIKLEKFSNLVYGFAVHVPIRSFIVDVGAINLRLANIYSLAAMSANFGANSTSSSRSTKPPGSKH